MLHTYLYTFLFRGGTMAWGPFHKRFCAGVKMPAGLRSMLGVKGNPAKRKMNVISNMNIENHARADIPSHYFWRKIFSVIHASFWRGARQIQVMKLKFVHAIKFWRVAVSSPA